MPRNPSSSDPDDDDGHLLVYVYDNASDTSALHVYDARTMDANPVAVVRLNRRVPTGECREMHPIRSS